VVAADSTSFPTIKSNQRADLVRLQITVMRSEHAMYADLTRHTSVYDRSAAVDVVNT
jgi:hypothetical protein